MEVILDNVATGIITTDEKGNILLMNRAAKAILGVERDDWMGKPLRVILGSELRKIIRFFQKEMKGESTGSVVREMRLSLRKDTVYLRASLTVLKDEAGRVEGYISTFDDITHIVRGRETRHLARDCQEADPRDQEPAHADQAFGRKDQAQASAAG